MVCAGSTRILMFIEGFLLSLYLCIRVSVELLD